MTDIFRAQRTLLGPGLFAVAPIGRATPEVRVRLLPAVPRGCRVSASRLPNPLQNVTSQVPPPAYVSRGGGREPGRAA